MEPVPLRHRWEVCNNTRCCSLIVARWNITGLHKEAVRPLFSQTQVSLSSYELSYDSLSPFPYNCICSPSLSLAWFPCLAPSAEENLSFLWKQWCRHRPSSWTAPYVNCLSIAAIIHCNRALFSLHSLSTTVSLSFSPFLPSLPLPSPSHPDLLLHGDHCLKPDFLKISTHSLVFAFSFFVFNRNVSQRILKN